ncbi:LOW QUALITY PROTEIN: mucin-16-like [Trichechus inunguis]
MSPSPVEETSSLSSLAPILATTSTSSVSSTLQDHSPTSSLPVTSILTSGLVKNTDMLGTSLETDTTSSPPNLGSSSVTETSTVLSCVSTGAATTEVSWTEFTSSSRASITDPTQLKSSPNTSIQSSTSSSNTPLRTESAGMPFTTQTVKDTSTIFFCASTGATEVSRTEAISSSRTSIPGSTHFKMSPKMTTLSDDHSQITFRDDHQDVLSPPSVEEASSLSSMTPAPATTSPSSVSSMLQGSSPSSPHPGTSVLTSGPVKTTVSLGTTLEPGNHSSPNISSTSVGTSLGAESSPAKGLLVMASTLETWTHPIRTSLLPPEDTRITEKTGPIVPRTTLNVSHSESDTTASMATSPQAEASSAVPTLTVSPGVLNMVTSLVTSSGADTNTTTLPAAHSRAEVSSAVPILTVSPGLPGMMTSLVTSSGEKTSPALGTLTDSLHELETGQPQLFPTVFTSPRAETSSAVPTLTVSPGVLDMVTSLVTSSGRPVWQPETTASLATHPGTETSSAVPAPTISPGISGMVTSLVTSSGAETSTTTPTLTVSPETTALPGTHPGAECSSAVSTRTASPGVPGMVTLLVTSSRFWGRDQYNCYNSVSPGEQEITSSLASHPETESSSAIPTLIVSTGLMEMVTSLVTSSGVETTERASSLVTILRTETSRDLSPMASPGVPTKTASLSTHPGTETSTSIPTSGLSPGLSATTGLLVISPAEEASTGVLALSPGVPGPATAPATAGELNTVASWSTETLAPVTLVGLPEFSRRVTGATVTLIPSDTPTPPKTSRRKGASPTTILKTSVEITDSAATGKGATVAETTATFTAGVRPFLVPFTMNLTITNLRYTEDMGHLSLKKMEQLLEWMLSAPVALTPQALDCPESCTYPGSAPTPNTAVTSTLFQGTSVVPVPFSSSTAAVPFLVPFTLNFTITNLQYMEDMDLPGSGKFSFTEKILQHLLRPLLENSSLGFLYAGCRLASLRPEKDRAATRVDAICTHHPNPERSGLDREQLYWELSMTHGVIWLGPDTLARDSLCVNAPGTSTVDLGTSRIPSSLPIPTATSPTLVPFTLNFTITNLRYTEDIGHPKSAKFNTTEKVLQHMLGPLFKYTSISTLYSSCRVASLRPKKDGAATRVDAICTYHPDLEGRGLDREQLYWELSHETHGVTQLDPYTLDSDSLYVNGYTHQALTSKPNTTGPALVPFTLNCTITNLHYKEDMRPPGSLKYNTTEKILQCLLGLLFKNTHVSPLYSGYRLTSLRNPKARQQIYWELNQLIQGVTQLGSYTLNRDSLYVNAPEPTLVPFTLNFTITNLRYMDDMGWPGSTKFNLTERILQHVLGPLLNKTSAGTLYSGCRLTLSRPKKDREATRVDTICTLHPEPEGPRLDREQLYWELNQLTCGVTLLGPYTLDRNSLYVNGERPCWGGGLLPLAEPKKDGEATRVDTVCTLRPEPDGPKLDREWLYWELNQLTQGIGQLGHYTLDRDSLYVNAAVNSSSFSPSSLALAVTTKPTDLFTLNFTITNLHYTDDIGCLGSTKFNLTERILQ